MGRVCTWFLSYTCCQSTTPSKVLSCEGGEGDLTRSDVRSNCLLPLNEVNDVFKHTNFHVRASDYSLKKSVIRLSKSRW